MENLFKQYPPCAHHVNILVGQSMEFRNIQLVGSACNQDYKYYQPFCISFTRNQFKEYRFDTQSTSVAWIEPINVNKYL